MAASIELKDFREEGGGESKEDRSIISDATEEQGTKLQLIRRENKRLVKEKAGENQWEALYGQMKSLYDYEKRRYGNQTKHKRMIRRKCSWPKLKYRATKKKYKSACSCFIFRDVDKDQYEQIFRFGLQYPEDLNAPNGRVWVNGGSIVHDNSYDKNGDTRSVADELAFYAREKGLKRVGNNWEADIRANMERWRRGEDEIRVPRRPVERGAAAAPRGLGLDAGAKDEILLVNVVDNINKELTRPEAGGGKRRKSRKRRRKRKTKRKKRKSKRRRKKRRTKRKK